MTLPSIRDSASYTSSVDETLRAVMPTDVQEDDLLVMYYAGDGNLATLLAQSGDFHDWCLRSSIVVSNTLVFGELTKWADGTEGGSMFIAGTSPSEKWCVSVLALENVQAYIGDQFRAGSNTGSANPNLLSVATTVGVDYMFLVNLAGEGATATTASPTGYTDIYNLNNGAADGVSLRNAYKAITASATSEDPAAFTRASTAWGGGVSTYRGLDATLPKHQRIVGRKSEVLSGGTKDYTVTVRAGTERRFFCALHAASSTVSSITLDPGGPDETELTPVQTAGGTFAESAASGAARAITWYEVWPVPAPGSYTLRVVTSVTTDCALLSQTMLHCEQRPVAYDVLNSSGSGAPATGNIDIPDFGMILSAGVQPLSLHPTGTGFIWQGGLGARQVSSWTPPHYCTVFARRVSGGGSFAQSLEGATTGSTVQSFSAFSVRYARDHVDPLLFGGF